MINPMNIVKMIGERKAFVKNHPDFIHFILKEFGETIEPGTVIELKVTRPDKDPEVASAKIRHDDKKLLEAVRQVLRDVMGN